MKKRILSLILALMLVFTSVPMERVFADTSSEMSASAAGTFTISADGIVSAYSDTAAAEIIVPETIDGTTVTQIAAGAFDGSKYSNLKSVAVLGRDVTIGANAFGYISGSRIDGFKVWGYTGSTTETWANQKAITFSDLAESITELTSSQEDLSQCFSGGNAIFVSTVIAASGSEDIIWTSEDSSLVSITPYTLQTENGQWVATAQVKVLATSDEKKTCKIFAKTRSGLSKELELTLAKPATEVNLTVDVYQYNEDTYLYDKVTPSSTYMDDENIYVDKGYFVSFNPDCGEDNDDTALYSIETGTSVLDNLIIGETNSGENVYLYEVKKAGTIGISAITASGQVLKQYNLIALQPATDMVLKLNGTAIGNGISVVQGYSGKLTVTFTPSSCTDTVTWSSNNSIVQISSDGTVNVNGYGTAVITCTVNNAKSMPRDMERSFTFYVSQKYNYNQMAFIDNVTDKNIITEANIAAGTTQQLSVFDPSCTDNSKTPNEPIYWSSSDTSIATIDSEGVLTTKSNKNGTVKVTARSESGIVQTLNVYVYVEATKITPEASSYQIPEGQTVQIPYTMTPSNTGESVTWISDDSSAVKVVGVEADVNTAGRYILTLEILKVTDGFIDINGKSSVSNVSSQIQVKGLTAIHATNISLVPENYVRIEEDENGEPVYCVEKGTNFTITASVTPSDSNDALNWGTWFEGSTKPVTVTTEGRLATVTAKSTGTVEFSCEASGGFAARCKVKIIVSATSVDILSDKGVSIDVLQANVGDPFAVKAKLSSASTDKVHWSLISGDADALHFSNETTSSSEFVNITADKMGTYVIRATADSGKYADLTVNAVIKTKSLDFMKDGKKIESLLIVKGGSTEISLANILPSNTSDSKYNWEETKGLLDITAASDGKSANIIALSTGKTSIKVTGESGAAFILNVTILNPAVKLQINEQDEPQSIVMNRGDSKVYLYANLTPSDTDDRVTWTVNKEGIVSITQIAPIYGPKQKVQIQGLAAGTVVITATTESGLSNSITVEVQTVDISKCVVTFSNLTYTGKAIEAVPSSVKLGTVTLKKGTDYEIIGYDNNTAVGTATIHIRGIGKYAGTKDAAFQIKPRTLSGSNVSYTNSSVYTGKNFRPPVTIQYNGITLVKGRDYKVTYPASSVNVGSYTLKVELMGNYSGTISKSYKVVGKSISGFVIKNKDGKTITSLPSKNYTSKAITQTFYVYDGTKKLTEGTHYTVKYSNNINAGTATVKIYGKGIYSATTYKTITFTIKPYSLANVSITAIADKPYTGSDIKPSLVVKRKLPDGTYKTLSAGSDYEVTFSNNTKIGKATAEITVGKNGNYYSSKKVSFKIVPKQVVGLKQSSASQKSVKLSWTKDTKNDTKDMITGYAVYKYNTSTKKYTYVKSTSSTSVTISGLSAGSSYVYAVRAYKKVGSSTKYYSPYSSNVTVYTVPKTPSISLSTSGQSVTVKWAKVTNATKYYVYYSTDGGKTYKKAGSSSSTSYKIPSLTKGKKVYVKVKSAKTIAGKEYLSPYSSAKTITVK